MSNLSFKVSPQAVASIHDDGIVILHTPSGRIYTSNTTGVRIWTAIQGHLPLESIADEISAAYQITRTTAREHAQRFLSELEQNSLVQREIPL